MIKKGDLVKCNQNLKFSFSIYREDSDAIYLIQDFLENSILSKEVRVKVVEHINPNYIGLTFLADLIEFCKKNSKHSISKTIIKELYENRRHLHK